MKQKKIHILGGGTVNHVRTHLAISSQAYGTTARTLHKMFSKHRGDNVELHLTKMASAGDSHLETNADIEALVKKLVADPETSMIVFNVALADFEGEIDEVSSDKYAPRLTSRESDGAVMTLKTAEKIIKLVRKERKDIFLVAFKATSGASEDEQYMRALSMMKESSVNLVLANDVVTRKNMVVTPEESRYYVTEDRQKALQGLTDMSLARSGLSFTRAHVIGDAPLVPWSSSEIPDNLRQVVDHLIAKGAYQPFRGKTVGHFAARGGSKDEFLTSIRKSNFNNLSQTGLVRIFTQGDDRVIAHGAKPSVGGQSQRIIFNENPDLDVIVHFHGKLLDSKADDIPVCSQWEYECGSHECGRNTAEGLTEIRPGIYAVMLDQHGPNIVFNRNVPAEQVIEFIEQNFALGQKTGGNILPAYRHAA